MRGRSIRCPILTSEEQHGGITVFRVTSCFTHFEASETQCRQPWGQSGTYPTLKDHCGETIFPANVWFPQVRDVRLTMYGGPMWNVPRTQLSYGTQYMHTIYTLHPHQIDTTDTFPSQFHHTHCTYLTCNIYTILTFIDTAHRTPNI